MGSAAALLDDCFFSLKIVEDANNLLCKTPQGATIDFARTNAHQQILEDGTFGTSPLKEYPARMSAAMLASTFASFAGFDTPSFREFTQRLLARCEDIDNASPSTPRGAPPAELDFLVPWPSIDASFDPDFCQSAVSSIRTATRSATSRRDFPYLLKKHVQEHVIF